MNTLILALMYINIYKPRQVTIWWILYKQFACKPIYIIENMLMADGICHMGPRNHATNQANIYIYIQPMQYQSAHTWTHINIYVKPIITPYI